MSENSALGEEISSAQENLRLSAGQVSKLNNELKITCNENEELKRRVNDTGRKMAEYENRIAVLNQEIERLNVIIESKNKEIRSLSENVLDSEGLGRQVRSLNDQIKRLTG